LKISSGGHKKGREKKDWKYIVAPPPVLAAAAIGRSAIKKIHFWRQTREKLADSAILECEKEQRREMREEISLKARCIGVE
jgi:hypothetical protein